MKVELIKQNLRNIYLLAKEYRERVPFSDSDEAKRIKKEFDEGKIEEVSPFEKKFFMSVLDIKHNILEQMSFFAKKILKEYAPPDQRSIKEIDHNKAECIRKFISLREARCISSIYTLEMAKEKFDRRGVPNGKAIYSLEELFDDVIKSAFLIGYDNELRGAA